MITILGSSSGIVLLFDETAVNLKVICKHLYTWGEEFPRLSVKSGAMFFRPESLTRYMSSEKKTNIAYKTSDCFLVKNSLLEWKPVIMNRLAVDTSDTEESQLHLFYFYNRRDLVALLWRFISSAQL